MIKKLTQNLKNRRNGFTLAEIIIYLAIFVILIGIVISFSVWSFRSGSRSKINYEVADNARRAMETIVFEIKESKSIYWPTSIINDASGQISLEQAATSTPDEVIVFTDIFKCGNYLCLKKEGENLKNITNSQVKITKLMFSPLLNSTTTPSVQIDIKIESNNQSVKPEYSGSIEITTTATLRKN